MTDLLILLLLLVVLPHTLWVIFCSKGDTAACRKELDARSQLAWEAVVRADTAAVRATEAAVTATEAAARMETETVARLEAERAKKSGSTRDHS